MPTNYLLTLIAHFGGIFHGPNGDYPALLESLDGISAAQALWKPGPDRNSIWQIVEHVTGSMQWGMDILENGKAESPKWIEPSGGEAEWQATLSRLKDAHARLKAALARIPEPELQSKPVPGWDQTQLELLLSWASHVAYHARQIDYIKGLQQSQASR